MRETVLASVQADKSSKPDGHTHIRESGRNTEEK